MSYKLYLPARGIRTGSDWVLKIEVRSASLEVFPTDATFVSQVRETLDGPVIAELTTANEGVVRISGNELELRIRGDITRDWLYSEVVLDVLRTDALNSVHLGFDMKVPVKRSVTRISA